MSVQRHEWVEQKLEWIQRQRKAGVEGVFRAVALNLPMPPAFQESMLVPRSERVIIPRISRRALEAQGASAQSIAERIQLLTEAGASAFVVRTFSERDELGFDDVLVAAQNTHLPVVCHDLFLDPLQITVARAHGAAAVVLSAEILDERQMRTLRRSARDLSLDTIMDVAAVRHFEELERSKSNQELGDCCIFGADLLGVSATDATRLRERVARVKPEHGLCITALDSEDSVDLDELSKSGYHAFVIDASMPDLDQLKELVRRLSGERKPELASAEA